jgi:hypothetical protein
MAALLAFQAARSRVQQHAAHMLSQQKSEAGQLQQIHHMVAKWSQSADMPDT